MKNRQWLMTGDNQVNPIETKSSVQIFPMGIIVVCNFRYRIPDEKYILVVLRYNGEHQKASFVIFILIL